MFLIAQCAVRARLVELLLPRGDLAPRVPQVLEPTHIQAFIAQLAVETFHVSVLLRLPRLNVHQLDAPFHAPGQKMPAGEVRPVVAANRQWVFSCGQNHLQRSRHSPAGKAGIHFQRQTLPGAFIQHAQHADRSSADHRVVRKVRGPFLVGRRQSRTWRPLAHEPLALSGAPPTPLPGTRERPTSPIRFLRSTLSICPCPDLNRPPTSSTGDFHPPTVAAAGREDAVQVVSLRRRELPPDRDTTLGTSRPCRAARLRLGAHSSSSVFSPFVHHRCCTGSWSSADSTEFRKPPFFCHSFSWARIIKGRPFWSRF